MGKKLPNLLGKTALITGASSGLGEQFAHLLAAQQCNLILVARRQDRLQTVETTLEKTYGIKVTIIICDLAQPNSPEVLVKQINGLGMQIDILINNAGVGIGGVFCDNDTNVLKNMLSLNMVNLALLTQMMAKEMVQRHSGHILFVSSIAGELISPRMLAYSATKSFVTSLGLGLKIELAGTGVECSVLAPGPMETEFFKAAGINELALVQRISGIASERVATEGLEGLFNNKAYIIPGIMNKISVFAFRLIPRIWMIKLVKIALDIGKKST